MILLAGRRGEEGVTCSGELALILLFLSSSFAAGYYYVLHNHFGSLHSVAGEKKDGSSLASFSQPPSYLLLCFKGSCWSCSSRHRRTMIEPDFHHISLAITSRRSERLAHFGARDIGWQALGPAIACAVLSTAVVGLRWYTRARLVRCLGWDDYVILLSLVNPLPLFFSLSTSCLSRLCCLSSSCPVQP